MPSSTTSRRRANGRSARRASRSPTGSFSATSRSSEQIKEEAGLADTLKTVSPANGRVYVERPLAKTSEVAAALAAARRGQAAWRAVPVAERARIVEGFVQAFEREAQAVAEEISWQMGRPIGHSPREIRGLAERARYMAGAAAPAPADIAVRPAPGFTPFLSH